jgi:NADP-dependent 3-hydroxy acid dehydrogenase YdfG
MATPQLLAGQVALVTGASRGIGRAIAVALAREGCSLALSGRHQDDLAQTVHVCRQFGSHAIPLPTDLRELSNCASLVEQCVATFGQLNILVNNAGIFDWASVVDADLQTWDAIVDLNMRASMHLTHHAVPHIMQHQRGAILFIASQAGKQAYGTNAAYVASKHAIVGFAHSIFEDVRDYNIKVCAICPGYVNAGASRTMDVPEEALEQFIQPEDVAEAARFVLTFPNTACPTEILLSPQHRPPRT